MTRQNLSPNPSAKVNATGWSGTSTPARATDFPANLPRQTGVRASTGVGYLQVPTVPCAPGDVHTLSFYQHNGSAAFQFTRTAYVGYTRSSGGDTFPQTWNTGSLGDIGAVLRTSFTTDPAPANATGIYFLWDSTVTGLGMTGVMIEKVGALDVYGDGDVPGWEWDGTAGNSSSTMTAETLFSGQVPASVANDDSTVYSLGSYITAAVAGTVTHLRRWAPSVPQPGGNTVLGALFDWSTGTKISNATDAAFGSTQLDWWDYVALDPPVHVSAGAQICPAVRTEAYAATTGGASPWPFTSGDLSAASGAGRFNDMGVFGFGAPVPFPSSAFSNGCYFVDVVFVPDGDIVGEGSAALGLGLAADAAGAATHDGTTDTGLVLAVAAGGAVQHAGSVAMTLDLAVAATGSRSATGAAALGLNLAPSSVGSNGTAARPRGPRVISRSNEPVILARNGDPRIVTRVQAVD
jgi:hypothetical protein